MAILWPAGFPGSSAPIQPGYGAVGSFLGRFAFPAVGPAVTRLTRLKTAVYNQANLHAGLIIRSGW